MFTSSLKSFCNGTDLSDVKETQCGHFAVFPRVKCYPIFYSEWTKTFEPKFKEEVLNRLNTTGAYFFHIWNKMQSIQHKNFSLTFQSESAYIHLAKKFCPKTYNTLVKYF